MKRCAILAGLVLFAAGCDETSHRPFVVRVTEINGGAPLQADVLVVVDAEAIPPETAIPEDVVSVRIESKPYSSASITDPNSFAQDFQVTSYRVTWRFADGTPLLGFDFDAATSVIVPANGSAEFGVLIAPAGMKAVDPFVQARAGAYFQTIADFDIVGAFVSDPSQEIHLTASLSVNFADFADDQ